jgi:dienelactone hydrolase
MRIGIGSPSSFALWAVVLLLASCGSGDPLETATTGDLAGSVRDATTANPVPGATVSVAGRQATTPADGSFAFGGLAVGAATLAASAAGYESSTQAITVAAGDNRIDIVLARLPAGGLSGHVRDMDGGAPIAGATVTVGSASATTGADGSYQILNLVAGTRQARVFAEGFDTLEAAVTISAGSNQHDFLLVVRTFFAFALDGDSFGAYVPRTAGPLRGTLFVIGGSQSPSLELIRGTGLQPGSRGRDYHDKLRTFADAQGFALVGEDMRRNDVAAVTLIGLAVESLAEVASRSELEHAPLLFLGYSWGGCRAYVFTSEHGERVAGFISMKGGCHPEDARPQAQSVPGYMFIGEFDTSPNIDNITAVFEAHRQAGAVWALAVEPGTGHALVADTDLLFEWLTAVVALRLPQDATPGVPAVLAPVAEADGWLGDRTTFEIAPLGCYSGDPGTAAWLPSLATARSWQALVSDGAVDTLIGC